MLELRAIRKAYTTASLTQVALNDVSVAFRDSEFVAVLGQSGSGKTTMLNIIGGLDRFDSGDLVIDGISTREYTRRDWDTYRNNRIGFVFQAYNLISHQSVLSNVELALTLSGVSRAERKQRALQALATVGLSDHVHKKPQQLSGGQMQRVAIARALVNDPEILLADEPTGALDSETSVQVMDLLKEVAQDRLVIMVTHNPDLAHAYATRIVELSDGQIIRDSHPCDPSKEKAHDAKAARRSKMGFLTALSLSFSNLMTKKGRTVMTAFAGSIGIIGIASILALANGVDDYIARSEESLLTSYPLTINRVGFDITNFLPFGQEKEETSGSAADSEQSQTSSPLDDQRIMTKPTLSEFLNTVNSNDLKSLKAYFEQHKDEVGRHVQAIEYVNNIEPLIYLSPGSPTAQGKVQRAHPSSILENQKFNRLPPQMTRGARTDSFRALPAYAGVYEENVTLLKGKLPQGAHELLVVVGSNGELDDYTELNLGLRDVNSLGDIIDERTQKAFLTRDSNATANKPQSAAEPPRTYTFDDILNIKLKHVHASDFYVWDSQLSLWADKSNDTEFVKQLVEKAPELRVVGIAKLSDSSLPSAMMDGVYYTPALVKETMRYAAQSDIVKKQLSEPSVNVLSGKNFADEAQSNPLAEFDMSKILSIDNDRLREAFATGGQDLAQVFSQSFTGADLSSLNLSGIDFSDITGDLDLADLLTNSALPGLGESGAGGTLPAFDLSGITFEGVDWSAVSAELFDLSSLDLSQIDLGSLIEKYPALQQVDLLSLLAQAQAQTPAGSDPSVFLQNLLQVLGNQPEVQAQGQKFLTDVVTEVFTKILEQKGPHVADTVLASLSAQLQERMESQLRALQSQFSRQAITLNADLEARLSTIGQRIMERIALGLQTQIEQQLSGMTSALEQSLDGIKVDQKALGQAFTFTAEAEDLSGIFASLINSRGSSFEDNLKKLGYGNDAEPDAINIYPKSFQDKEDMKVLLANYNAAQEKAGHPEKVIAFSDLVGALMSQVTSIVSLVSAMLVAFVSISLIVSSIMIGIITYISVLERKKEIGILRSIGASRSDIRHVFNAETLIVGFLAGVIGIGVTLGLTVIANVVIEHLTEVQNLVALPPSAGFALIGISMLLTLVAGLLPSNKAAKADPVEALRSE